MEALNENEILINKLLLNEKVIEAVDKLAEDLYKKNLIWHITMLLINYNKKMISGTK